jgi:hypothetical protein
MPARLSAQSQRQQVMNSAILEKSSAIDHGSMIGSHRWKKIVEK